jgi:hypothetical protein
LLWAKLKKRRAEKVVGIIFERVLEKPAASRPPGSVTPDIHYKAAGKNLQMDVLVEEDEDVTLLEVKAKSLTEQARGGDLITYLGDYTNSYLAMVLQLVRHERHLRAREVPAKTILAGAQITKVAVSPLTFGPLSDRALTRSLLTALISSRLVQSGEDQRAPRYLRRSAH